MAVLAAGEELRSAAWDGSSRPSAVLGAVVEGFSVGVGFKDTVLRAVNLGGPADAVGALSGQLAGAHYGFDDSNADTVRGLTIIPAVTAGIDKRVGSIEVGKDADLVVLGRNLFETPPSEIHQVKVDLTLRQGRVLYEAGVLAH